MLRPHQIVPAKSLAGILRTCPSAADLSDMGVGKTFIAAWVIAESKLSTLCVVPKISVSAWHAAAQAFGDTVSVIGYESLRTGRTPFGYWDNPFKPLESYLQCTNCQCKFEPDQVIPKCYCRPDGLHCFESKKKPHRYGRFHFHPAVEQVVFDEVHRCGGLDSLNGEMLIAARRENKKILLLSATLAQSPLGLRAIGYALDLHKLGDYYNWAARFGCKRIPGGGFKWMAGKDKQASIMAGIRDQIIPARGVRVTKESIADFPDVDITAELYDLGDEGKLNKLYAQLADALAELKVRRESDKSPDHPLTKMLRAKQEIELLKVPVAVELAQDYLDKGCSVAIFVNYTATLNELRKRLKTDCVIDGSVSDADRAIALDTFQENRSRSILLNSNAGNASLSLHDKYGARAATVGIVFPGHDAVILQQIFGRLPRHGGKSKSIYRVLFAAKSVEVPMHRAVSSKLDNLAALNDADLRPESLAFASV